MSFDVDVAVVRGDRTIAARFVAGAGITVLHGRSGAGKTSVLDMVAGLLRPARGHVRVGDATLFDAAGRIDLLPERRRLGYVFQDARLFPHRRVRANLLYGHRLAPPDARWLDVDEAIDLLGIRPLLDRWPRSLSGGEAQRVAIGRALLSGARALLMGRTARLARSRAPRRDPGDDRAHPRHARPADPLRHPRRRRGHPPRDDADRDRLSYFPIITSEALTITVTLSPSASPRSAIASSVMLAVTIVPPPISTLDRPVHRTGMDRHHRAGHLIARADLHIVLLTRPAARSCTWSPTARNATMRFRPTDDRAGSASGNARSRRHRRRRCAADSPIRPTSNSIP